VQCIYTLSNDFLKPLNLFRDWVFQPRVQEALQSKIEWQPAFLHDKKQEERAASLDYLMGISHADHNGYPPDQYGLNLNYGFLQSHRRLVEPKFFDEVRDINNQVDDELQMALGARFCALKMFYPENGYIAWHTNWNVPGYNIIFTYSEKGNGYWRHIDPKGANDYVPRQDSLVHIDDVPGWHCKVGYFGKKEDHERLVWHSAYTREPRLTVSYVIFEENLWTNMVEELSDAARRPIK